jgi:hypothetical protein
MRCWALNLHFLKTMQNNVGRRTNFLVHQEALHIGTLIAGQLNDFPGLFVFLNCTIAGKVLFKGLTYSLDVQVIGQTLNGGNTLATVALLHTNVHFVASCYTSFITCVFKRICKNEGLRKCHSPQIHKHQN